MGTPLLEAIVGFIRMVAVESSEWLGPVSRVRISFDLLECGDSRLRRGLPLTQDEEPEAFIQQPQPFGEQRNATPSCLRRTDARPFGYHVRVKAGGTGFHG